MLVPLVACLIPACVPDEKPERASPTSASAAATSTASTASKASPRPTPARRPRRATGTSPGAPAAGHAAAMKQAASDPLLEKKFTDDFERKEIGHDWRATSSKYAIDDGRLCVQGARNHPIWLARKLPDNARIEFDATTSSADGDIKAEYWGNGFGAAQGVSYNDASSYLTIFGGWKNRFHVLARIDEHARDRPEIAIDPSSDDLRARPVERDRKYHFKVERNDGKTVRWLVDDITILELADKHPLRGPGHDHFGFNDWDVRLCFDNLEITPLPPSG